MLSEQRSKQQKMLGNLGKGYMEFGGTLIKIFFTSEIISK